MIELRNFISDALPVFYLLSAILINLIIWGALLKLLWGIDATLISGVIAFWGAIIGGALAYRGVVVQLKHRNREVFLNTATERLGILESLLRSTEGHLNGVFIVENMKPHPTIDQAETMSNIVHDFLDELVENKEVMYKTMTYDEMEIIRFHEISLNHQIKVGVTEDNINVCAEKVRSIFNVIYKSKEKLRERYYRLRKIQSKFED